MTVQFLEHGSTERGLSLSFFFRRHNAAAREASSLYQQQAVFSTGLHGSEPRCLWKSPLNAWKRRHKHYSRQPLLRWTSKPSPTPPEQSAQALLVHHREQQARHAPRYKTRVTSTVSWEAVTHDKRALLVFNSGQRPTRIPSERHCISMNLAKETLKHKVTKSHYQTLLTGGVTFHMDGNTTEGRGVAVFLNSYPIK